MTSFADLGLSEGILKAVADAGYNTPTPIQEQAIPQILMMRDVLGCAQTGTGKTASFTLPMLDIMAHGRSRARMPRSIILEPTRELAAQVAENFATYGKYLPQISMALLIGGEQMDAQVRNLERGVDVLIATPGRMLDLFERGRVILSDIQMFVIDEADRMLDMGFIPDVEKIASLLPQRCQTLLFSATMPPAIRRLADKFLHNPRQISVSRPSSTAEGVKQSLLVLPSHNSWQKREALRRILKAEEPTNAFIFCNRKRDVAILHRSLLRHGFNAGALHGDMEQPERMATLARFRAGEIKLLVCSDVAARGLDVPDVSHVINFDVPTHAEDYVHRIGRTGRAGREGITIMFVTPDDTDYLTEIESLIRKKLPREVMTDLPEPNPKLAHVTHDRGRNRQRHNQDAPQSRNSRKRKNPRQKNHIREKTSSDRRHSGSGTTGHIDTAAQQLRLDQNTKHQGQLTENDGVEKAQGFGNNIPAFLQR